MTPTERKSINNGIWMCRPHATLIDMDDSEYSTATLKLWKDAAEAEAYENLKQQNRFHSTTTSTFIQIGIQIIVIGKWREAHQNLWKFEISNYFQCSEPHLLEYISSFDSIRAEEKFVVIESQGDARQLAASPFLEMDSSGKQTITFQITGKHRSSNPHDLGMDLALGDDGDLKIVNGDLGTVSGVEAAVQSIATTMSTIRGEVIFNPTVGSLASKYYSLYKDNLKTLSALFKLEMIRLSLIPSCTSSDHNPALDFVKRFNIVSIEDSKLVSSRIKTWIEIEWGSNDLWKGAINIFISDKYADYDF